MEIIYKGIIIRECSNPYVNEIYPIGSNVEVDSYWFDCGWLPILNSVIDSAILDLKNVEWQTKVDVFI